eukprot:4935486-Amphidinium_carterae.2
MEVKDGVVFHCSRKANQLAAQPCAEMSQVLGCQRFGMGMWCFTLSALARLRTSQQAHSTPTSAPRSAGRGLAYTVPVWVPATCRHP